MSSELHIQIEVNLRLAKLQRSVFYNEVELLATWNDFFFLTLLTMQYDWLYL